MDEAARYEWFAPGFQGEREIAAFWLVGPLKSLERRSNRENGPDGHKPSGLELLIALTIGVSALAVVSMLV